jgi:hypothetical protein
LGLLSLLLVAWVVEVGIVGLGDRRFLNILSAEMMLVPTPPASSGWFLVVNSARFR